MTINFDTEIPYTIDGREQHCDKCGELILIGDYFQYHDNDDCTMELMVCKKCLVNEGYSTRPIIFLVKSTVETTDEKIMIVEDVEIKYDSITSLDIDPPNDAA